MTEDLHFSLEPQVQELGVLLREGTAQWRKKETAEAEQKILKAAQLRCELSATAEHLLQNYDIDFQKLDRMLAETLNNMAIINFEQGRAEPALELATRALELFVTVNHKDGYFSTLDLLKEIYVELNKDDRAVLLEPGFNATGSITASLASTSAEQKPKKRQAAKKEDASTKPAKKSTSKKK